MREDESCEMEGKPEYEFMEVPKAFKRMRIE
jgi:hypothetical protein